VLKYVKKNGVAPKKIKIGENTTKAKDLTHDVVSPNYSKRNPKSDKKEKSVTKRRSTAENNLRKW
jgi:hypothetical protein